MPRNRRRQHLGDETRLAIEHVDLARGDFAVHQQRQAELAHAREHGVDAADVGDAGIGIGGGAGGIELAAVHEATGPRALDFLRARCDRSGTASSAA